MSIYVSSHIVLSTQFSFIMNQLYLLNIYTRISNNISYLLVIRHSDVYRVYEGILTRCMLSNNSILRIETKEDIISNQHASPLEILERPNE
jgi:hypothetical protein